MITPRFQTDRYMVFIPSNIYSNICSGSIAIHCCKIDSIHPKFQTVKSMRFNQNIWTKRPMEFTKSIQPERYLVFTKY